MSRDYSVPPVKGERRPDYPDRMQEVRDEFLRIVRDDTCIPVEERRHKTRAELGWAIIFLGESGHAEQLLEDPDVEVHYNQAYAEVFSRCMLNGAVVSRHSWERQVLDRVPDSYKRMKSEWGQLPNIRL